MFESVSYTVYTSPLSSANRCTCVAFVGMATVVLSVLYRKRQTRIESTVSFWSQFWEYIQEELYTNKIVYKNAQRQVFEHIHPYLHIDRPSDTVLAFLSTIIDKQLNQIITRHFYPYYTSSDDMLQNKDMLWKYLEKDPLKILVPLCGSSYDLYFISTLLQRRYQLHPNLFRIIGIESSETAIVGFFHRHNMGFEESCYNPKYIKSQAFYRIWMYSNTQNGIYIVQNDIYEYYQLSKTVQNDGIAPTPCLIEAKSIDIIVDINAMSCCNPSDRKQYVDALKYWLSDKGCMLLNTYSYDPKLSNYPPFMCDPNSIHQLFYKYNCKLLLSKHDTHSRYICDSQSWIIEK